MCFVENKPSLVVLFFLLKLAVERFIISNDGSDGMWLGAIVLILKNFY
jgi:hypothetical protein